MTRRARAALAASVAGGLVLTGLTATSVTAGAATTGASITIGSAVAPPSLDPTSNASAAIDEVFDYNVYQHLVQLDPKGAVVPVLATAYTVSPNGLTYTFDIRQGVKFSNGDPLTASDVVFSLERADAPKSTYPYAGLVSGITSVTAPTASTVVVKLSAPDNQFLYNLAAYSNGVVLDPSAVGSIATAPVGTGPYEYTSQTTNYDVVLSANPTYWGGAPKLSTVTFRYFSSPEAENSALKSGQIDVIDNLPNPSDVSQFKGNSSFKIVSGPTAGKIQMTINNTAGPLKNVLVREAINYATDKAAILQTAGAGYGTVIGSDNVPGEPWYLPSLDNPYPYSVSMAKKLLKEAGYPNGFSVTLTLPPYGYATSAGPLLQAELDAVGIKTTIKDVAFPLWISSVFLKSDFQLTIINHVEARDQGNYANCSYYWKYKDCAEVAKLLNAAQKATTTAEEISRYQGILKKITAAAVNDWLFNPDQLTIAKSDVVGIPGGISESFDLSHLSIGGSLSSSAKSEGYAS